MDTGRDGAAGIFAGDAPEVAEAKGKRPGRWDRGIVKIVTVFVQEGAEVVVVFAAVEFEEFGAGFGDVHAASSLFVAQALARRPVVRTKVSVGFSRGAVGVVGKNIRGHGPRLLVSRIAVDAVENGREIVIAEQPQVGEENIDGDPPGRTHRQSQKPSLVESDDGLGVVQMLHDLSEIARQRAWPAKCVDAIRERRGDQLMETLHPLDAWIVGRQEEWGHERGDEGDVIPVLGTGRWLGYISDSNSSGGISCNQSK